MPGIAQRNGVCGLAVPALGLLGLALTLSASQADLPPCDSSFYGHAPPALLAEAGLKTECHALVDGRSFAKLHNTGCGATVYTAFHLSPHNGWGRGAAQEEGESGTEDADDEATMFVPALYRRGRNTDPPASASPLQKMDALSAEVVENRLVPLCSKAGGNVYVQSGVGGLNECQTGMPWSAVCCAVPDRIGSFSAGMVQEGGGELRTVSVEELEELLGVQELFPGGCGERGGQEEVMSLLKERVDSKDLHVAEVDEGSEVQTATHGGEEAESLGDELGDEPEPTEASVSEDGSFLLYVLSSLATLLCAPFCAVASILTSLLSNLAFVLWEDVAMLVSVPGDSLTLAQNLACGMASGVEGLWDIVYRVAEVGVGSVYACASTLGGALLLSCQEGLVGTGSLACDALGLATGALEQGWEVGVAVVGWAGQQLGGYLGTVGSEMVQQTWTVGEGVGTLALRSQRGVCHLLHVLGGVMGGVVENTLENAQEAFAAE